MHATISKWGDSLALRLPRRVADQLHLGEGTTVELEVADGVLKVTPPRKRFKLSELIQGEPKRDEQASSHEVDWGGPRGDEAW
jgi:antitoxin MazE